MDSGTQRVTDLMLDKFTVEVERLFKTLGIDKTPIRFSYDKNYFELAPEWLGALYSYPANDPPQPIPLDTVHNWRQIPSELAGYATPDILGFSCNTTPGKGNQDTLPAVFINSHSYLNDHQTRKPLNEQQSIRQVCHTFVHEAFHANSHQSRGFQHNGFFGRWPSASNNANKPHAPAGVESGFYEVLDEGTTEFFARIVSAALHSEETAPQVPIMSDMPVYEFPLAIACNIARNHGIDVLAKAFFSGDRELQLQLMKVAQLSKAGSRYSRDYFEAVSSLSIENGTYVKPRREDFNSGSAGNLPFKMAMRRYSKQITTAQTLRKMGVVLPIPNRIAAAVKGKSYLDPALTEWRRQIGEIPNFRNAAITTLGSIAAAYAAYQFAGQRSG